MLCKRSTLFFFLKMSSAQKLLMEFLFLSRLKLAAVLIQLMFLEELGRSGCALLSGMSHMVTLVSTAVFSEVAGAVQ